MDHYESERRYYELAEKWKDGSISPEEEQEFARWYMDGQDEPVFLPAHYVADAEAHQYRMIQGLKKKTGFGIGRIVKSKWISAAAAIFIAALATALYFYPGLFVNRASILVNEIGPGGNRATLTLADGTKINLDSAKAGIQINDGDINYNDGTKIKAPIHPSSSITYNLLTTPKGGQYQIILSDGTKVWLNAQSTLKYPARFSENNRAVEITGEAFFDVAHIKSQPFKVKSKGQVVDVLGTSFNISAYNGDVEVKTTLVTGVVQVANYKGSYTGSSDSGLLTSDFKRLNPGQQAINTQGNIQVKTVDIDKETAWRNGLFDFTGKTLREIMPELARWYDIDVVYDDPVSDDKFLGKIYRNNKLSQVLAILQSAQVQFRLEGRRLIIHNGNQP